MFNEDLWQKLKNESLPIVLYGTGNAAEKIASLLEERGIEIAGIFASDDFVRNKVFLGHQVKSLAALEDELGDFVVLLCFGSHLSDVIDKIKAVSRKHTLYAPDIPVVGEGLFDADYYKAHAAEFEALSARLADEQSRRVLDCVIKYKLSGDLRWLFEAESAEEEQWTLAAGLVDSAAVDVLSDQGGNASGVDCASGADCADGLAGFAAPAKYAAAAGAGGSARADVLLDLGAYTGDTARLFAQLRPGFKAIYAAEPEARNFRKLSEFSEVFNSEHPGSAVYPLNIGIGDKDEEVLFSVGGGRGSRSKKLAPVRFTSVDRLLGEVCGLPADAQLAPDAVNPEYGGNHPAPDVFIPVLPETGNLLIKMDLEGWEMKALEGAKQTIIRHKPNLLISAYHRTDDLLIIPEFILSLDPSYKVYLRHSPCVPAWEVNYIFVK